MIRNFDAILFMSFGGPEGPDDVLPFLKNVVRGRNVPDERLVNVAKHYNRFGGISPINAQNREIISKLHDKLIEKQINLPLFWGNRNWHPLITDTVVKMHEAKIKNAITFVTAAFSSYSSCQQYKEDIENACKINNVNNLKIFKIRPFFNHPLFIQANIDLIAESMGQFTGFDKNRVKLIFTAHSIPLSMDENCDYQKQLLSTAKVLADAFGVTNFKLAYQSRSGSPRDPWLEPDILDVLNSECNASEFIIIVPIGFISDHMEIIYDLDIEAKNKALELGLNMVRAKAVSNSPIFINMIVELIEEVLNDVPAKIHEGFNLPSPDCDPNCCPLIKYTELVNKNN